MLGIPLLMVNSIALQTWETAEADFSASYGGPANFSGRLHASAEGWNGTGDLEFMNDWTYKLGEEGRHISRICLLIFSHFL